MYGSSSVRTAAHPFLRVSGYTCLPLYTPAGTILHPPLAAIPAFLTPSFTYTPTLTVAHLLARHPKHPQAALDKALGCHDLMGAPLLVVANKQDIEGAAGLADVADAFGLGKLDSRPVIVQPASAYTGQGLSDGLKWLVEAVKRSPRRHLATSRRS